MASEWKNMVHAMLFVSTNGVVQYSSGFNIVEAGDNIRTGLGLYQATLTNPVESIAVPGSRRFCTLPAINDLGPGQIGVGLSDGFTLDIRTFDGVGVAQDHAFSVVILRGMPADL